MMRGTWALVLAALCAQASAFRVATPRARPLASSAVRNQNAYGRLVGRREARPAHIVAFGGDDKFLEASMEAEGLPAKLGTPLGKALIQGIVIASAAGGWTFAPSVRPVVKGICAGLAGGVGFIVRKRLIKIRRKAATGVLAKLLSRKGVSGVKLDEAWQLAQSYGVRESEFVGQLVSLYGTYLYACLRSPTTKTAELSDLLTLQRTFQLGFDAVGDAIFDVSGRFYSEQRAYFESDEPHEAKQKLDKLVFLADRALSEDPSEEGFRYERTRISKKFGLSDKDWAERVERVAAPFYKELLASVSKDPSAVSARDLAAVGDQLGLSESTRVKMKMDELRKAVSSALEASGTKFTASQLEKLRGMCESLAVSEEKYRQIVETAVAPSYAATVNDAFSVLESSETDESAQLLGKLAVRQQELDLTTPGASKLEIGAAQQRANSLVSGAITSIRSQNTREAAEQLTRLCTFADRLVAFIKASGKAGAASEDAELVKTYFGSIASATSAAERNQLYRVFLLESLDGRKVDPAKEGVLARLRTVLGVSEADSAASYEEVAGPIYRGRLLELVGAGVSDFPASKGAELKQLEEELGLPESVTLRMRADAYKARLAEKAGDGKIPSEADDVVFEAMRTFLALDAATVEKVHVDVCSGAYLKSVQEVMGGSGIILDEYREGLEKLQARLRIPDAVAEEIYLGEARRKLKEMGGKAVTDMLDAMQKEADSKKGDDAAKVAQEARAGITAESTKLVDFARQADLLAAMPDGKEIAKVNLRGLIDPRSLKELYRQYLVECFQGQGESSERLFAQSDALAQVLGLEAAEVRSIQTDLGSLIYRNYISKVLNERTLNDDDRDFLASIQQALGMDAALCDRLLVDMKKMRVSTMVEQMFDGSKVSADEVLHVRETSERFGLELGVDLQLPQSRLVRMLRCEMEEAIEKGEVPPEDTSKLSELQEAYQLPEAVVAKELEACIERRCAGHLLQAASALRRNQPDAVLEEVDLLLRFNSLMPFKVKSSAVQPNELQDILMRYQSNILKDGPASDVAKARMNVLRTALGLEEPAEAAQQA